MIQLSKTHKNDNLARHGLSFVTSRHVFVISICKYWIFCHLKPDIVEDPLQTYAYKGEIK